MFPNKFPEILETTILCEETFFQMRKERLKLPDNQNYDYYTLESSPYSVMVIATTADHEYVLNWEYRHPTKKFLLSSPGGIMHADETPLICAQRELLEETGYFAEDCQLMGEAFPFPGVCTQKTYFVRAYGAKFLKPPHLEVAEMLETELFSEEKLKKLIAEGQSPIDSLLLAALFFAQNIK